MHLAIRGYIGKMIQMVCPSYEQNDTQRVVLSVQKGMADITYILYNIRGVPFRTRHYGIPDHQKHFIS